ncbi:hypothetical protein F2P81_017713 [Scophthalmus maximus]|uniref:Uncharacterized protein n=1 Tax=Scophthalmus maximus TaxID=52904 RepID=A0A6A4SKW4_SCOMX|nr:hypothetical protein F2P81_017713 [Scophthalmus maximus]
MMGRDTLTSSLISSGQRLISGSSSGAHVTAVPVTRSSGESYLKVSRSVRSLTDTQRGESVSGFSADPEPQRSSHDSAAARGAESCRHAAPLPACSLSPPQ